MVILDRYLVRAALGEAAFSVALHCVDLQAPRGGNSGGSSGGSSGGGDGGGAVGRSRDVCLKVVKNNKDYFDQSLDEIKLLSVLRDGLPSHLSSSSSSADAAAAAAAVHRRCVLQLYDYFYFREHLILSTELLGPNLCVCGGGLDGVSVCASEQV
jgi:hypothetical protein